MCNYFLLFGMSLDFGGFLSLSLSLSAAVLVLVS